jgi:hypothetical protein
MNKNTFLLLTAFCFIAGTAGAQTDVHYRPVDDTQVKRDIIYGYAPGFLSDTTQYSFTAEQEGHYILGQTERPLPRMPDIRVSESSPAANTPDVLISAPVASDEDQMPAKPQATAENRQPPEPRVNDSQDVENEIKRHPWIGNANLK